MGINDRDYVRKEGPSFLGSFVERGTICKWLIGVNVAVFVVQLLTRDPGGAGPFTDALLLDVNKVLYYGEVWRLFTHAFLHSTSESLPFHILWNMLFLWWFGSDMEDLYGPREFLAFYLSSAFLGGLAFTAAGLLHIGGERGLGASGAVTAVMVLFAIHYPTRVIRVFYFLPVPIWLFVIFHVGYDLFTLLGQHETGVGVAAHLGGAAFGFFYYKLHWRISTLLQGVWPNVNSWRRRAARPHLRVYREERPEPVRAAVARPSMEEDRIKAEMDAVLDKITRVGRDNLTEDELEVLQRASEILRRRRT